LVRGFPPQQTLHAKVEKRRGLDRFADESSHSQLIRNRQSSHPAQHHHWELRRRAFATNRRDDFWPAHVRHLDVHQGEIERTVL
jgi:hypothetical protein